MKPRSKRSPNNIPRWIADPLQEVIRAARGVPSEEIKIVPVRGPHEVQDLTRAFNAMAARVQSSRQSQRNFVANASHELKTPLTSIQGSAQAILDGAAETPEALKQAAEIIYNESSRMHRMALDLLNLARLDAGTADLKMSPVQTDVLLNAVAEKFSPLANGAGVNIAVNVPKDLPALVGNGDRLSQAFTNLVDNALKFTPAGGSITLQAGRVQNEMQIQVSDTGRGSGRGASTCFRTILSGGFVASRRGKTRRRFWAGDRFGDCAGARW